LKSSRQKPGGVVKFKPDSNGMSERKTDTVLRRKKDRKKERGSRGDRGQYSKKRVPGEVRILKNSYEVAMVTLEERKRFITVGGEGSGNRTAAGSVKLSDPKRRRRLLNPRRKEGGVCIPTIGRVSLFLKGKLKRGDRRTRIEKL